MLLPQNNCFSYLYPSVEESASAVRVWMGQHPDSLTEMKKQSSSNRDFEREVQHTAVRATSKQRANGSGTGRQELGWAAVETCRVHHKSLGGAERASARYESVSIFEAFFAAGAADPPGVVEPEAAGLDAAAAPALAAPAAGLAPSPFSSPPPPSSSSADATCATYPLMSSSSLTAAEEGEVRGERRGGEEEWAAYS
jgi:hypothetical protein